MKNETERDPKTKTAGLLYAAAYRTHHMLKDFAKALVLYKELIALHPHSKEAGFAQTQIRAIEGKGYPRHARSGTRPDKASSTPETPSS